MTYRFGSPSTNRQFCATNDITAFSARKNTSHGGVNLRCLTAFDYEGLTIRKAGGKSH